MTTLLRPVAGLGEEEITVAHARHPACLTEAVCTHYQMQVLTIAFVSRNYKERAKTRKEKDVRGLINLSIPKEQKTRQNGKAILQNPCRQVGEMKDSGDGIPPPVTHSGTD